MEPICVEPNPGRSIAIGRHPAACKRINKGRGTARQDQLLDEAVQETYPASDPISPKRIE